MQCNESLVWFDTSGFYYIIKSGHTLGLLSDIILLPCILENLYLWICMSSLSGPLYMLQKFIDKMGFGRGYFIVPILGLGCSWVGPLPSFPHHHHQAYSNTIPANSPNVADRKSRTSSSALQSGVPLIALTLPWPALLFCPGEV